MKSEHFHPRKEVQIYYQEEYSPGLHPWLDSYDHNLIILQCHDEEEWIPGRLQEVYLSLMVSLIILLFTIVLLLLPVLNPRSMDTQTF